MVQSSGSSATIALTMAVVADIATSAQRGKYSGYANCGILFGPALGPTIGGTLSQYLGWRSIFWFLAIFSAIFLFLFAFLFPETCRNVVGNGSIPARGINLSILGHIQRRKAGVVSTTSTGPEEDTGAKKPRKCRLPNPLLTLRVLAEKESGLLLVYLGLFFSGQMYINAALPSLLASTYGYNDLQVGLCFVPIGLGALTASIWVGYAMDWNFRRHAARVGLVISNRRQQDLAGFPLERARVQVILPNHLLTLVSVVAFGWVVQCEASIAIVEVLLFCVGTFLTAAFNASNALLVDLHRESPATATAAVNLVRCLFSAVGVAVIIPMIDAMGRGWAFTVLGSFYVVLLPALWVLVKWGPVWREDRRRKNEARIQAAVDTPCRAMSRY